MSRTRLSQRAIIDVFERHSASLQAATARIHQILIGLSFSYNRTLHRGRCIFDNDVCGLLSCTQYVLIMMIIITSSRRFRNLYYNIEYMIFSKSTRFTR